VIDGELTAPPSSIHCFRDVTLFVKTFSEMSYILVRTEKETVDFYYKWLKNNHAYDHVDGILTMQEHEPGIVVGFNKPFDYPYTVLNEYNYSELIARLMVA
jgi:hypothetical protein